MDTGRKSISTLASGWVDSIVGTSSIIREEKLLEFDHNYIPDSELSTTKSTSQFTLSTAQDGISFKFYAKIGVDSRVELYTSNSEDYPYNTIFFEMIGTDLRLGKAIGYPGLSRKEVFPSVSTSTDHASLLVTFLIRSGNFSIVVKGATTNVKYEGSLEDNYSGQWKIRFVSNTYPVGDSRRISYSGFGGDSGKLLITDMSLDCEAIVGASGYQQDLVYKVEKVPSAIGGSKWK
jgi:hypothetical protein